MLDVHPPEHAAHTWRDFFIHIATIVIGLLIAIGLEQTVELVHHHREVNEARERITAELERNQTAVEENTQTIVTDSERWRSYATQLTQPQITADQVAALNFSWHLFLEDNAAWEVAKQGVAFPYIPASETQRYSYLYRNFAENYATSLLYIRDIREADAIVQRVRATHTLQSGDRERLIVLNDKLIAEAKYQLEIYTFLNKALSRWLHEAHH